jgi:hypothetical protein
MHPVILNGRFLVEPSAPVTATAAVPAARYSGRLVHWLGVCLVGFCCLSGCLALAQAQSRATPVAFALAGDAPPAVGLDWAGLPSSAWVGLAGIITILVNGLVAAILGVSKTRAETRRAIAESEGRIALAVALAKEEVRRERVIKDEADGQVISALREEVSANTTALAEVAPPAPVPGDRRKPG